MNTRYIIKMIFWAFIASVWVGLSIIWTHDTTINIILINVWVITFFFALLYMLKWRPKKIRDERLIKLSAYSYSYSWLITFLSLWIISFLDEYEIVQFTLGASLLTIMLVMSISFIISNIYLNYKWDIN